MITNSQRLKLIELFADYQRAQIEASELLNGKRPAKELPLVIQHQTDAVNAFTNYVRNEL
jgi:hypothetical protein